MALSRPVVEICNPLNDPIWDESIESLPGHSIFHSRAWATVLNQVYRYQPLYLRIKDGPTTIAALPLMEVNSWLTGRRGVSLPFTDHCPALTPDAGLLDALFEKAFETGKLQRWKYLEFRGNHPPRPDATPSIVYFGHRLDLTAGPDRLFASLDSATRRAVRKAQSSGVTVEFSTSITALRAYYRLHCHIRKTKHGLPPQPWTFFQALHKHIMTKGQGKVALAKHIDKPIAGAVFFHFRDRALFKFGASNDAMQHLRGNNQVMWEAIKHFACQGFATLDFGRSSDYNTGLRRFKRGFGAEEVPLHYHKFDFTNGRFVRQEDRPVCWYNRLFKVMPQAASRSIGCLFYKHLG